MQFAEAPALLQVGLLILLSVLLRAVPAALLLRCQALLLGGKKYSSPTRLPLLLWLINQTARWALELSEPCSAACHSTMLFAKSQDIVESMLSISRLLSILQLQCKGCSEHVV